MASTAVQRAAPLDGGAVLSKALDGAKIFVKEHKKISTSYVVGIMLLLFGTGFKVSDDLRDKYDATIEQIDFEVQREAHGRLWQDKAAYDRARGWFSCDAACTRLKRKYEASQARWGTLKRDEARVTSEAKSQVGILSEYGVQETRDLFWGTFAGGKDFAKRQSVWDLLFTGLRWGKDEELFSVVLRWLVQLLFNFTLGLVGALVVFVCKLWGLIAAYSPDPATAVVYFLLAAVSATACVATYLLVLYGAAAGSVVVVAKAIVDHNHRIGNDPRRARQNIRGGGPPAGGYTGGGAGGYQRRAHFD